MLKKILYLMCIFYGATTQAELSSKLIQLILAHKNPSIQNDLQKRTENFNRIKQVVAELTRDQLNAKDSDGNGVLFYTLDYCTNMQEEKALRQIDTHGPPEEGIKCCKNNPGNVALAEFLIASGADVNMVAADGETMLLKAIKGCVVYKGEVTSKDNFATYTMVCNCWIAGKLDMAVLLLKSGARLRDKDKFGKSALDYAQSNPKAIKVLWPYMNNPERGNYQIKISNNAIRRA